MSGAAQPANQGSQGKWAWWRLAVRASLTLCLQGHFLRIIERLELQGTHKDHQFQPLSLPRTTPQFTPCLRHCLVAFYTLFFARFAHISDFRYNICCKDNRAISLPRQRLLNGTVPSPTASTARPCRGPPCPAHRRQPQLC